MKEHRVVVLDSGGGTLKAGFAGDPKPVKVFPNCTAKIKGERQQLFGDVLHETTEVLSINLRRPIERGFPVNFDLQREIWARTFKHVLGINPTECGLVLTEPPFCLQSIRSEIEQLVFEDFGFQSLIVRPCAELALRRDSECRPELVTSRARTGVVIDAGFSFTHIIPVFDGKMIPRSVRRLNFGGKAMTNYFKELVSYRSLNLMDETYLVEGIKESLCFVSMDMKSDLKLAARKLWDSPHRREFVLPDGVTNLKGYVRDKPRNKVQTQSTGTPMGPQIKEQVLVVNNERFTVPEVLFHPTDIGLNQAGLAESVTQAVNSTNPALHPLLYSNVLLCGGVASCPGFKERLIRDLRPMVPDTCELNVHLPVNPVTLAWEGGSSLGVSREFKRYALTKAQYEENGVGYK